MMWRWVTCINLILLRNRVQPTTTYTPIASLDQYGSVPQIRNAATASDLHGSLTLVGVANRFPPEPHINVSEEAIVVVSLERNIPGRIYPASTQTQALGQKQGGKIHVVAYQEEQDERGIVHGYSNSIAIIGSGFKSDLGFLLNLLRIYACNYWERYDIFPQGHQIAWAVSQVMLRFMGYDELAQRNRDRLLGSRDYANTDMDLFSMLPHVLRDLERGDEWVTIGRPLGLRVFVSELRQSSFAVHASVRIVEPSGIISQPILAHALGRKNKEANKLLRDRYKQGMSSLQLQDMCVDIMKEVVLADSTDERQFADHILVCDVLHKDGIDTRRIPLS